MPRQYRAVIQVLALMAIDALTYYILLGLVFIVRNNIFRHWLPFSQTIILPYQSLFIFVWLPAALLFVNLVQRLYRERYPFWEEVRALFKSITLTLLFFFLAVIVRNMFDEAGKAAVILMWALLVVFIPVSRFWGKKLLVKAGIWKESVLIIGASQSGLTAAAGIIKEEHLGYDIIAFLDDDKEKIGSTVKAANREFKVYGPVKYFETFIRDFDIDTVFIVSPVAEPEKLTRDIRKIQGLVKRVILVPDIQGVAIFNSAMHYLFSERLFMIKMHNNLNSTYNRLKKRAFDLFFSIIVLVFSWWLFLVLALVVRLTSKGPVVYSHKRVGRGGREFSAYKFRSMYSDSKERLEKILASDPEARKEWEATYKLKNDPRVTPIGRILRKTSLDEIPQLFNIIKGEMSWVGPRPVIRDEIEKYYGAYKEYYYSVTPGLSGLWQVSGRSDTDYAFRTRTDAWYVMNWSMWLDITIIMRTFSVVLKARGAY